MSKITQAVRPIVRGTQPVACAVGIGAARAYSKATLVGRVGSAPQERQTSSGKTFYAYSLAVAKAPKKDEQGNVIKTAEGFVERDAHWYSILKFAQDGSEDPIKHLAAGDMVLVEASMSVRQLGKPEGEYPRSEIILVEDKHKVLGHSKGYYEGQGRASGDEASAGKAAA